MTALNGRLTGKGLFFAGTDTDVGKTAAAATAVADLAGMGARVGIYKPVASGARGPGGDADRLWQAAGRPLSRAVVCPQSFAAALAPVDAARAEGRAIDEDLLRRGIEPWRAASDLVVVEGAGGLFSPVGPRTLVADLVREFGLPLVLVDAARLGLVGRTLMAVRAACAEGLHVAAVVVSQTAPPRGEPGDPTGDAAILRSGLDVLRARLSRIPVGVLAHGAARVEPAIDWMALAGG
ncbi:MAG: dethiobiotin synthase [Planctomycetaceae bacterium]